MDLLGPEWGFLGLKSDDVDDRNRSLLELLRHFHGPDDPVVNKDVAFGSVELLQPGLRGGLESGAQDSQDNEQGGHVQPSLARSNLAIDAASCLQRIGILRNGAADHQIVCTGLRSLSRSHRPALIVLRCI